MYECAVSHPALPALFDPALPDHPALWAVLKGRHTGKALVDDLRRPSKCVLRIDAVLTFACRQITQAFLDEAITLFRQAGPVWVVWPAAISSRLREPGAAQVVHRLEFYDYDAHSKALTGLRRSLPDGSTIQPIDRQLLERCEWRSEMAFYCGSLDNFLANSLGLCLMRGDEIVVEAYVSSFGDHKAEIGAVTREAYRGHGYAPIACAYLIEACEQRGFKAYWNCDANNPASIRVARKLGFLHEQDYQILEYNSLLDKKTMTDTKPNSGSFKNGIPYSRLGKGQKTMLVFFGGPGNLIPTGFGLQFFTAGLKPFLDEYTVYILSRKPGLPQGYTTQDMSDDYAELIRGEFGGHVAVVIGVSYGGMIAQHFAADHADLCDHLVIAMSTHKLTEAGARLDTRFAELLSQGKVRQASVVIVEALYPAGIGRWLMSAAMWLLGGSLFGAQPGTYQQDVLIEAKAEVTHDSLESLKRIQAPVLILVGGNDFYFTSQSAEEMAAMIPNSTLKIYPGKGHEIMNERRFGQDIAEFIAAHPA